MDVVGLRGHRSRLLPAHLHIALNEVEQHEYVTAKWVSPQVAIPLVVQAA